MVSCIFRSYMRHCCLYQGKRSKSPLYRKSTCKQARKYPTSFCLVYLYVHFVVPISVPPNMSSKHSPFQYDPLQLQGQLEIRLVTILPDKFEACIQLGLSHLRLDSMENGKHGHPPVKDLDFEALSYNWGIQPPTVSVSLNKQKFMVSPNLSSILRHLRRTHQPRAVWIDAICINQDNEADKMSQLPIMHVIYAQARNVIVWLGDSSSDSHLAMEYIKDVHAPVEIGKEDMISDEVPVRNWPLSHLATAPLNYANIIILTAFYKLLKRPWWYRAWIVQEMGLARTILVQCGRETVTFSQMKVALLITRKIHAAFILYTDVVKREMIEDPSLAADWPADAINNALNLEYCRRMILKSGLTTDQRGVAQPVDVSWSFWSTRARLCRQPHDRTFSILGIAGKDFRDNFISAYADPIEEHDRNTVRAFVAATNSLDIILHSQHSIWLHQCSSWAPNWSQPERAGVFHLNGQSLKDPIRFHSGDAEMPKGTNLLHVKGRILGEIESIRLEVDHLVARDMEVNPDTMAVTALADPTTFISRRRRWWIFKSEYESGEMFDYALACLPRSNPLWTMHLELFLIMFARIFRKDETASVLNQLQDSSGLVLEEGDRFQDFEPFWDLLEYLLMSRTVCEMKGSGMVVASDIAQPGDIVAILAGCSNPVVLRKSQSDRTFRLLSDAHVLGVNQNDTSREGLVTICIN
jgi:hypothetical protein